MCLVSLKSPTNAAWENRVGKCMFLVDNFTCLELEVALHGLRELQVPATKESKLVTRSLLLEENGLKNCFLNRFFFFNFV